MAAAAKSFRLFVSNLPWTTNSTKLNEYFSRFGKVNFATVIFDKNTGLSRGFGFVVFNNEIGFSAAKEASKHVLDGNNVKVEQAASAT